MKGKKWIIPLIVILIISPPIVSGFNGSGDIPIDGYTDPPNDLLFIFTGEPVPPEMYMGCLDVILCRFDQTPETVEFCITINAGIPSLEYTTFWTVLIDADNSPEDNCPSHPYNDVDTMYSLIYDSSEREWRIERSRYESWGWDVKPTDATWGMTSSWPDGKPQILLSVPIYELSEILTEILPWKVVTEMFDGPTMGDVAPNEGLFYTNLFAQFMFMEGVFQPVQVVYQHDPVWGDNMSRTSSSEWVANIPMIQEKNTFLFGYPYNDRNTIRFNITNLYVTSKTFNLNFWVRPENKKIWETGTLTVGALETRQINLSAPIPWSGFYYSPTPFQFEKAGNTTIEVEVAPTTESEPIQCNKVTVHTMVKKTKKMDIVYVPIVIFDGTTGVNLHAPVSHAEATDHAKKTTEFIKGTYPVAEDGVTWRVSGPFRINLTEVRAVEPWLPAALNKVNMAKVNQKLANHAATIGGSGLLRVVGLIPDGHLDWPETYDYGENATHWRNATWKGVTYISQKTVVFVVSGWWGTTCHELGHTFELKKAVTGRWEEYNKTYSGNKAPGYWVNKKRDQPTSTICFMGNVNPYKDFSTWVGKPDFHYLLTKKFPEKDPEVLFVNGLISKKGTVELSNWYHLPTGTPDIALGSTGSFRLVFLDEMSQKIGQVGFDIQFLALGDEPLEVDVTCFAFFVPFVSGTAEVQIIFEGLVVGERVLTANSPAVTVSHPNGGEILNPRYPLNVTWSAEDPDGDPLTYSLLYSEDSGDTWLPLASDLKRKFYVWNTTQLTPGADYLIKVVAADGVNLGGDCSDNRFCITFMEDINNDGEVNILDISTVARAFGSQVGDPTWNPVADIDENGVINILDVSATARKFGKSL